MPAIDIGSGDQKALAHPASQDLCGALMTFLGKNDNSNNREKEKEKYTQNLTVCGRPKRKT